MYFNQCTSTVCAIIVFLCLCLLQCSAECTDDETCVRRCSYGFNKCVTIANMFFRFECTSYRDKCIKYCCYVTRNQNRRSTATEIEDEEEIHLYGNVDPNNPFSLHYFRG